MVKKLRSFNNERQFQETFRSDFWDSISNDEENKNSVLKKIESIFNHLPEGCARLLNDLYLRGKSFLNIKEEQNYKNVHTVQNMKYKCMQQVKKAKRMKKRIPLGD